MNMIIFVRLGPFCLSFLHRLVPTPAIYKLVASFEAPFSFVGETAAKLVEEKWLQFVKRQPDGGSASFLILPWNCFSQFKEEKRANKIYKKKKKKILSVVICPNQYFSSRNIQLVTRLLNKVLSKG